jgi:hypothetical protein
MRPRKLLVTQIAGRGNKAARPAKTRVSLQSHGRSVWP